MSSGESPSELQKLVSASKQGDKRAYGKIVLKLASLVTGVAYSVCGDFARSEDIGQEVFLEAWNKLGSLKDEAKFTAWICKIAKRRAIDEVRRSARRPATALTSQPIESKELNPEVAMERKQKSEIVWSMLEQLPEKYRETMVLYYRSEQSVVEVASALGESEPTIRQRLKRGREMLRVGLADLVSDTIRSTVPKAAFATTVMASLPATTYAAGAVGTTTAASKAVGASGGGAASATGAAVGGALFGSLLGFAGGFFGAWTSWKNAKYESQQRFVVGQSLYYAAACIVFAVALFCLIAAVKNGTLGPVVFRNCLMGLVGGGAVLSMIWTFLFIAGWKKIERDAVESGEPMRKEITTQQEKFLTELSARTRVTRNDGTVGYELFQWKASHWFSGMLGSSGWMAISAFVLAFHGNNLAAAISGGCFVVALSATLFCWMRRSQLRPLNSYLWMFAVLFVLAAIILGSFQFLTNVPGRAALSWSPWFWLVLLIFPAGGVYFFRFQRGMEGLLKEHVLNK